MCSPEVQAEPPAFKQTTTTAKRLELFSSPILSPPSFPKGKRQTPAAECVWEGVDLNWKHLGSRHATSAVPELAGSAGQASKKTSENYCAAKSLHSIILGDYFDTVSHISALPAHEGI